MKIPRYIQTHIDVNNRLLAQADKHANIVLEWYNKQLEKLNADISKMSDEDFYDIQGNWRANGDIDASAIEENLSMLEQE